MRNARSTVSWWALSCPFIVLFLVSTACYGFAGGSGTPEDPYQIADVNDLVAIDADPSMREKHYVLVADIDLDPNLAHVPAFEDYVIGGDTFTYPFGFSGTLDGDNHTIYNLNVSLFWIVEGTVHDLKIEGAEIHGSTGAQVGILTARNHGRIEACSVAGSVYMSTGFPVSFPDNGGAGGLAGINEGRIVECHAAVEITGKTNIGGLVGQNAGLIVDSHTDGQVIGQAYSNNVGGLLGRNALEHSYGPRMVLRCWSGAEVRTDNSSLSVGGLVGENGYTVSQSYATGTVQSGCTPDRSPSLTDSSGTGGLIGFNAGQVINCYATGAVYGHRQLGGLVGENGYLRGAPGDIRNSYATGDVISWYPSSPVVVEPIYVGGLVGKNSGSVCNGHFLDPNEGGGPDNGIGTPLGSDQMQLPESFVWWDFYGSNEDGSADHWFVTGEGYPILSWQTEATGLVPVPDLAGMTQDEARADLGDAGFVPGDAKQTDYDRAIPEGNVLFANPHTYAPIGSTVDLVLSQGIYDWSANLGAGTAGEPYLIATAGQLESLGDHAELWNASFALVDDIEMAPRSYTTALIAPGLGQDAIPFTGRFDGRGRTTYDLTIVTAGPAWLIRNVGLFGGLADEAEVRNLKLQHASVTTHSGYSMDHIGLLAGTAHGTISDCHVTGEILGELGYSGSVGGLVGENDGAEIQQCSAQATVFAGSNVGGLVGTNNGRLQSCYARTNAQGYETLGALVGLNTGSIEDCYAEGSVSAMGNDCAGTLVGVNSTPSPTRRSRTLNATSVSGGITNCYTTAIIEDQRLEPPLACLIGTANSEDVSQCFFLVAEGYATCDGPGLPLTPGQICDKSSFVGWDFYDDDTDGIEDLWFMPDEGGPALTWQTERTGLLAVPDLTGLTIEQARDAIEALGLALGDIIEYDYFSVPEGTVGLALTANGASYVPLGSAVDLIMSLGPYDWQMNAGDGSASSPYEIATPGQLQSLADHPELWDSHLVLAHDINLRGRVYAQAVFSADEGQFDGVFDGGGHTIHNLTVQASMSTERLGLFGILGENALVTDLGLDNAHITGGSTTGALVGYNHGTVARCYTNGTVSGLDYVGGLAGRNVGQITDCYAVGSVQGHDNVGGLLGADGASVGRGGWASSGCIRNCYTLTTVLGEHSIGAVLGGPIDPDIANCYYLLGQDIEFADAELCQGLRESQMYAQESFLDWDFENVWTVCAGQDSPRLQWENRPCP